MPRRDTGFQPVLTQFLFSNACILAAVLSLLLPTVGCNSLSPGNLAALSTQNESSNTPAVILIRGWRDLWSDGIDQLGTKLKADGVDAKVFKEGQSAEVISAVTTQAKAGRLKPPVVFIGFSYGADDVIKLSRTLDEAHQPVDLLIVIDPVTPADIPPNVRRCVNFYQSNGAWDVFPWLRGVPVKSADGSLASRIENIDIRTRPDLLEPDTSHKTIAGNVKVHAAILAAVRDAISNGVRSPN